MELSIFEAIMLLCFGASWPFAVLKTYKTKNVEGKSILFLSLVFLGYLAGITHKLLFSLDIVIVLYVFNSILVLTDIILYGLYKNRAERTRIRLQS